MNHFILTLPLFILPFLIGIRPIPQRDLHIGLWISLYSLGNVSPLFSLIVFGAALVVFFVERQHGILFTQGPYIQRPSAQAFFIFLSALIMLCALCDSCIAYGEILKLDSQTLSYGPPCAFAGFSCGPVIFGMLSDQKGPFAATIYLTFIAMASVGFSVTGQEIPLFFPFSIFALYSAVAGAFVLIPLMIMMYFGRSQLFYAYPLLLATLSITWGFTRYAYLETWKTTKTPESYLILMVCLAAFAAVFAWSAWKNRFTLV
ncbi:MAG: hypothetical protein IKU44_00595, partial [Firmicutes bacterium]|nr:hypothetical protein [Bacillota bacterium]